MRNPLITKKIATPGKHRSPAVMASGSGTFNHPKACPTATSRAARRRIRSKLFAYRSRSTLFVTGMADPFCTPEGVVTGRAIIQWLETAIGLVLVPDPITPVQTDSRRTMRIFLLTETGIFEFWAAARLNFPR
jgi:hypothetical protein